MSGKKADPNPGDHHDLRLDIPGIPCSGGARLEVDQRWYSRYRWPGIRAHVCCRRGSEKIGKSRNTNLDDTALLHLSSCLTHPPQSLSPHTNPIAEACLPSNLMCRLLPVRNCELDPSRDQACIEMVKRLGGGYSVSCHVRVLETMPNRGLRDFHSQRPTLPRWWRRPDDGAILPTHRGRA